MMVDNGKIMEVCSIFVMMGLDFTCEPISYEDKTGFVSVIDAKGVKVSIRKDTTTITGADSAGIAIIESWEEAKLKIQQSAAAYLFTHPKTIMRKK